MESMHNWSRTWEAGDQVTIWADQKGKGQLKASRSSATKDRVRNLENTMDGVQAGRGGESGDFPTEFRSPHSGNSSQR